MWRRCALLLAALVLAGAATTASGRGDRPVVVHPHYRLVGHDGEQTDGPETILWRGGGGDDLGTMVDERSGRRTVVRLPRGCPYPGGSQPVLGGGWLLVDCSPRRLGLYSASRGRWRYLTVRGPCRDRPRNCSAFRVGTDWVEYDDSSIRRGDVFLFESIVSGAVRRDPRTAHVWPDLDLPSLARRVCAPIRVPSDGSLAFEGRFVLVTHDQGDAFLQRCAGRLRVRLGPAALPSAIAPGAVVDEDGTHAPIRGIRLPGLQRFTVALPAGAADVIWLDLAEGHLYVDAQTRSGRDDVWSAPISALPR